METKIIRYSIVALIILIGTWTLGLLFVAYKHFLEHSWQIWIAGLLNSTLAIGLISSLFLLLHKIKTPKKILIPVIHFIYISIILFEGISLFYFSVTLELLDKTVFQLSQDQTALIMKNYFVFKWYYLLIPFPALGYYILLKWMNKLVFTKNTVYYPFALAIFSLLIGVQYANTKKSYAILSKNKAIHFAESLVTQFQNKYVTLTQEDLAFFHQHASEINYDTIYPFYRKTNTKNTLQPFFSLGDTPPNIIIIIVESLSASFSGINADEISYTPFLDSLEKESLQLTNLLATSERSFAALPSILGSLPHGQRGYTDRKLGYPKTETLVSWLLKNGYTGSFHYGGYAEFDYMNGFMKSQGITDIYDREEYNYKGTGYQTSVDDVPFGVSDKQFLQDVIEVSKSRNTEQPYIDTYFTLSMHYPYLIEEEERYKGLVATIIQNSMAEQRIKDKHKKYLQELATFLYTDDALKEYFQAREKENDHQNTIYLILGDHMMGEIPQDNPIEKYRPAGFIYSPLLTKSANFKGVNSHLDITPSFYNLLQAEYSFTQLDSVAWLGSSIDTSSTFRSQRKVLFMLNNRDVEDMLWENYFLSKDNLYTIGDRLQLTLEDNTTKRDELKKLRSIMTALHNETVTRDLLIP